MVAGIDGAGTVLASSHPALAAGRHGRAQRLGRRRDALGLPGRARAAEGRLAGRAAVRALGAPGDGDRHRRLHRDALPCSRSRSTASSPATARCSSPARAAASAASRSRCSRASAIPSSPRPAGRTRSAYLRELGAAEIVDRAELDAPGKPLQKERWAAAIDAVGSHTLVNALAQTRYGGIVAACGLAQGFDLPATVMPFILRGVTLAGIDSVMAPLALRQEAWRAAGARPRSGARSI